jgi:hypothetical protein
MTLPATRANVWSDQTARPALGRKRQRRLSIALSAAWHTESVCDVWLRGLDLNQRPSGYEPDELPGCSTPRQVEGECTQGEPHVKRFWFVIVTLIDERKR